METLTRNILEWHAESAPFPNETQTGDLGSVIMRDRDAFIFALDALGHGPEAATIAENARVLLEQTRFDEPLEEIFERCHTRFRGTRGLALCLAMVDAAAGTLRWLSVGNIQAVHVQLDGNGIPRFESLIMRAGVVGDRLPELRVTRTALRPGDMVVLATDGIDYGWYREYRADISPSELCIALIQRHCRGNDDAMALALRYRGRGEGSGT